MVGHATFNRKTLVLAYFTSRVVWLPRWPLGGSRGFPDGFQVGSEASRMTLLVPLDDSSINHPQGFLLQDAFFRIPPPGFLLRASIYIYIYIYIYICSPHVSRPCSWKPSHARFNTRNACGKPLRRKSTENGNTRNRRCYHLRQKSVYFTSRELWSPDCLQMFHGCDASQMPPAEQIYRYTDVFSQSELCW